MQKSTTNLLEEPMARCLPFGHPQAVLPAVMCRVCRVCWCAAAASAAAERGDGGDGGGGGANKAPGMRESQNCKVKGKISQWCVFLIECQSLPVFFIFCLINNMFFFSLHFLKVGLVQFCLVGIFRPQFDRHEASYVSHWFGL